MITAQHHTDAAINMIMTSFTVIVARAKRAHIVKSVVASMCLL
jgi:hypothetical protein